MRNRWFVVSVISLSFVTNVLLAKAIVVDLRYLIKDDECKDFWKSKDVRLPINLERSAIIIVDVWQHHWCKDATERIYYLSKKINTFIAKARSQGVFIVHAPTNYAKNGVKSKATVSLPIHYPTHARNECSCPENCHRQGKWVVVDDKTEFLPVKNSYEQSEHIKIMESDVVSTDISLITKELTKRNIATIFLVGAHLNMCLMGSPYGIINMKKLGYQVIIIRDLVVKFPDKNLDLDYTAQHHLFINWLERYWCPTVDSQELLELFRS